MPRLRLVRCLLSSLVLAAGAAGAAAPAAAGSPGPPVWVRPVDGPLVRPFSEGTGRFGIGGHAGADLAATPGEPVRSAGTGVVAFAGTVAGDRFVVVAHGRGLRTTYGYLAEVSVARGDTVEAGEAVGRAGGGGGGHDRGVVHFGLRRHDRYLDPMTHLGPPDLTSMVRLVPVDDPGPELLAPVAGERRGLLAELRRGHPGRWLRAGGALVRGAAAAVADAAGEVAGRGGRSARATARLARAQVRLARALGAMVAMGALTTGQSLHDIHTVALAVLWESGVGARKWWRQRGRCSGRRAVARAGAPPGHHVMGVAGAGSSSGADGSTFSLPVGTLGYEAGEVHWFSYAPHGGPYGAADTRAGPEPAAALLAEQLRALSRSRPGVTVDLVGHSQGGVVIETFLKRHYAADPAAYPPLGRVVTLAAPHRGSSLATAAHGAASVPGVGRAADALAAVADQPEPSSGTVATLSERSRLVGELRRTPLPPGVAMTTIGAVDDVLVTADRTAVAGAEHVVVDPRGLSDHSRVVTDARAVAAMRLALAGRPPPCTSLVGAVRGRVEPLVIRRAIRLVDALVWGTAR